MINVVPQPQYDRAWQGLEGDLNAFVRNPGTPRNEVYVIAGRFGASDHIPSQPRTNYNGETYQFNIDVPEYLWKVVLIPESSGKNPTDITPNDVTFGVILPNTDQTGQKWRNSVFSVNEIEEITGYNFFSNIYDEIQEEIENNTALPF